MLDRLKLALLVGLCLSFNCTPITAKTEVVSKPPSFLYIPRMELRTTMWRLAGDVVEITRLLDHPAPQIVSAEVVERLTLMQARAASLDAAATNHPQVDRYLAQFQRYLVAAKRAAEATPPNYFFAGRLMGSCTGCHDSP